MKKLILFDIDGTLIHTGGAGVRALDRAFAAMFRRENAFDGIIMAGKTDMQIMKEGLERNGLPLLKEHIDEMARGYLRFLREEIDNPRRELKPGIKEMLAHLGREGAVTGLLTGNLREGARIKLEPFGLIEHFIEGAYGSDHEDRDMLLPIAIDKVLQKGHEFAPSDCVVVGDTPRDVRCAKVHGAYCIAVATGPYTKDDLLDTDADIVLDSLAEREKYMDFLAGL